MLKLKEVLRPWIPRRIILSLRKLKATFKNIVFKITGNSVIQNLLEKNLLYSQYLMGIGSGSDVFSSGERGVFHQLKHRSSSPYCIFDVGSNKGQFLQLIFENISLNNLSIHCFEPSRETFKILNDTTDKDKRIKLNNIGLGKEKSQAFLYYDDFGSGLASLTKRRLDHWGIEFGKAEYVEIDTIDNYCLDNSINHIHLLKIDIEGHELDALYGAKRMFSTKSIDMVAFEFGGCNIDTRTFFQDFFYFFTEKNFNIFRITPSGYLHHIKSYSEIYEQFQTINFLAISNS
jgi:FkbM family methyltransferase